MKETAIIGIGLLLIAIIGIGYVSAKNSIYAMDEACVSKEKEIDNQLQRRYDMIPNYAEIVKKYAKIEEGVFTAFAEARSAMANASTIAEKSACSQQMEGAISRLMAVAESYPVLKSNENFMKFQDEFAGTENRLAVARKNYNDAVEKYNRSIKQFPGSLFHMEPRQYFENPTPKADLNKAPDLKSILND